MNYAIIENNICTNIIVADQEFADKIGAVELADGYGIGDIYIDGVWSKTEPIPPTEEELYAQYQALVVSKIREQYTADDENKVLREYLADNNTTDFATYNAYVVECKAAAYAEIYGETETTETETEVI